MGAKQTVLRLLQRHHHERVAFFGKLPCAETVLAYQLQAPTHHVWKNWLQAGFNALQVHYGSRLLHLFPSMPAWQFMLLDDYQHQLSMGTLIASCDSYARCFPFSIIRQLSSREAKTHYAMMPLMYKEVLSAEKRLCLQAWEAESQDHFFESVLALNRAGAGLKKAKIQSVENNVLNILNLGVMKQGLLEQHGIEDFFDFLHRTDANLRAFSSAVLTEQQGGICIPLPANKLNTSFVVFWLSLIEKFIALPKKRLWIFWNHAHLMVYYPRLSPQCFRYLLCPSKGQSGLIHQTNYLQNRVLSKPHEESALSESLSLLDVITHWR